MEAKELEDLCNNTGPEDETAADLRKRSRRVSFADNITTHLFVRDEELETPPDAKPGAESRKGESTDESDSSSFIGNPGDNEDYKELARNEDSDEACDVDEEDEEAGVLFVRNMDFSSPGSVAGSATSNEEDMFFGPVSTSFIRSGQLSADSSTSNNNHDITMDSTAFSLHFRSLMQSDDQPSSLEGNFKTPTDFHSTHGSKTNEDTMQNDGGSFMVLTGIKKQIPHCASGGRSLGSRGSNDMSLIVENPNKYDYGKLSPRLDALLAEVQSTSVSNQIDMPEVTKSLGGFDGSLAFHAHTNETSSMKLESNRECQPREVFSHAMRKSSDADDISVSTTTAHNSSYGCLSSAKETLPAATPLGKRIGMSNNLIQDALSGSKQESSKDSLEGSEPHRKYDLTNNGDTHTLSPLKGTSGKNSLTGLDNDATDHIRDKRVENNYFQHCTPVPDMKSCMVSGSSMQKRLAESPKSGNYFLLDVENAGKDSEPLFSGLISSLSAKKQQPFLASSHSISREHQPTPFAKERTSSPVKKEAGERNVKLSSTNNKIPKFNLFRTCEVATRNYEGPSSDLDNKPSILENVLVRPDNMTESTSAGLSVTGIEVNLLANDQENGRLKNEMHGLNIETPKNFNTSRLSGKSPAILHGEYHGPIKHQNISLVGLNNPHEAAVSTLQYASEGNSVELKNMKQATGQHRTLFSSPSKRLKQHTPSRPVVHSVNVLNEQNQFDNPVGSSLGQQTESTPMTNTNVSSGAEAKLEPSSLLLRKDMQKEAMGTVSCQTPISQTPMINRAGLNFYSVNQDKKSSLDGELSASHKSVSPRMSMTGPRTLPEKKFPVSPTLRQRFKDFGHVETHLISSLKRSVVLPDTGSSAVETMGFSLENNVAGNEADTIRVETMQRPWDEVFSKFSAAAKHILPTYSDKLNLQELGILEDIVSQLLKFQNYEKIYTERTRQNVGNADKQRVSEARWLQRMIMRERLRMQLLDLTRARLLCKVQQLKSELMECHQMKSTLWQHNLDRNFQSAGNFVQPQPVKYSSDNQDLHHALGRMRKEYGLLDHKLKGIINFFQTSFKIKGERSSEEIIAFVKDHLQKQERHRNFLQYLLLWELDDVERVDDRHHIILNYCGFLLQRIEKNNISCSRIVTSMLFNDASIRMSFPNLNAHVALGFIFKEKRNCRLGNPESFQQQTQLTSFLLGNLLDVLEEVQAALAELKNLIRASFHSPCDVQLELHLCFIDLKIGSRATLIVDMTDLNCGIYPCMITPSQLKIQISGSKTAAATAAHSAEVIDAVTSLTGGQHSMILRICRCVSDVVKSSSR